MQTLLPRLYGVFAIGLTWGVLWAAMGAAATIIIGRIDPADIGPGEGPLDAARVIGIAGLSCGLVFGAILAVVESRRAIEEVQLERVVMWGALVASAFPFVSPQADDRMIIITGPLGVLCALACAGVARAAAALRKRRLA